MQKSQSNFKTGETHDIYLMGKPTRVKTKSGKSIKVMQYPRIIRKGFSAKRLANSRRKLYSHDEESRRKLKEAKREHKSNLLEHGLNPKKVLNV
jgi:hypothetical protein